MGVRALSGGAVNPALPLSALIPQVVSAVFYLLAAIAAGVALSVLTHIDSELAIYAFAVFALLLIANAIPIVRSNAASLRSRRIWRAGDPVRAREVAARARSLAVASIAISTIELLVLAVGIFVFADDGAVRKTFLDGDLISLSFLDITKALGVNVLIAVAAMALSIVLGLLLAVLRLARGPQMAALRWIAIAIIDTFRSLPAIVVIYLVCFGLAITRIPIISEQDPVVYAIVALTLVYMAYLAELFRSGIEAIHGSQFSAALSLGLSVPQIYRIVVVPQMLRNIAPPLLGYFVALQKDTALVNVVGIIDSFTQAKIFAANHYNLSSVTVVCVLFIVITIPQTRVVDYLLARSDSRKTR